MNFFLDLSLQNEFFEGYRLINVLNWLTLRKFRGIFVNKGRVDSLSFIELKSEFLYYLAPSITDGPVFTKKLGEA